MSLPWIPPYRRSVLSRAVARWRAGNYNASLDALVDESGNGLHARLGSAVGADTNDPLRLSYSGAKAAYFPAVQGNYLSTPDAAANKKTAAFKVVFRAKPSAISPGSSGDIIAKYDGGTNNRQFIIQFRTGSGLVCWLSTDGLTGLLIGSTTSTGLSDDVWQWFRVDYSGAGTVVRFWYAADTGSNVEPTVWTQLGVDVTGSVPAALYNGSAALVVGARSDTGEPYSGWLTVVRLYANAAATTPDAECDMTRATEPYSTLGSSTGETWTFNRSASGRKLCVVDRDLLLLGTDDYLFIPNSPLLTVGANQNFTLLLAFRQYAMSGATYVTSKKSDGSAATAGYTISGSGRGIYADGTTQYITAALQVVNGRAAITSVGRQGTLVQHWTQNALDTAAGSVASLASTQDLYIGALPAGPIYADLEFIGGAFFREALTVADYRRAAAEMGVSA